MDGRDDATSVALLSYSRAEDRPGEPSPGGPAPVAATVPQRAEGIELIGEMEESGYESPPSIVRRGDGQVVQLTELLYVTLDAIDGQLTTDDIAAEVSRRIGRTATAENIDFLLDKKLRPMGLVKGLDGSEPELRKSSPLLALRWRVVLASERLTNKLTAPFALLFRRPIVLAVVAGFVAVCGWVLFVRGIGQGAREALYSPGLLALIFGLTILSAGFHEFGHAAACRYGGGRPGVMGAGVYLVWPAFYTDVTDAYRLNRAGRLRTDLGGLYFNMLVLLSVFGVWAVTGYEAFLLAVPLQLFQMLHQLLPFLRMDGYYILSDLTGVPDLFARIKPTLRSAVPGADTDERAVPLKRWVRVVVTTWVVIVVPLLLFSALIAAISLPRLAATAWDSLGVQWDAMQRGLSQGSALAVAGGVLSMFALLLPVASTTYMLSRIATRLTRGVWTKTEGRPPLRFGAGALAAATLTALVWLWWPNGEYRPIQPGERMTVTDSIVAVRELRTGRPGLTESEAEELGGAPSEREPIAEDPAGATTTTTVTTVPTTSSGVVTTTTVVTTPSSTPAIVTTTTVPPTSTTLAPTTTTTAPPPPTTTETVP